MPMKSMKCPTCGSAMKKNGKTTAGKQRWRCKACGASSIKRYDSSKHDLKVFLDWLLSKDAQLDMPGGGRSFRRHAERFWKIWPMPSVVDEIHRVIFIDGIWLARDVVILIACSEEHILSWHLARAETSLSYSALLSNIAPPQMVISDGGTGFAKARRRIWPDVEVQRCLFHAFCQVKRYTTSRPKLMAGIELYALAKDLLNIETLHQADLWVERFMNWCEFWEDFLEERSWIDGRKEYTHLRLRKARSSLVQLVKANTLFTYLKPELCMEKKMPHTNNLIEGAVNAQLRSVLRNHRGLSIDKRIKAVFWWCLMHTECPPDARTILEEMPTDDDIDVLNSIFGASPKEVLEPVEWGSGIVWSEFHHATRYPYSVD